MKAKPKRKDLSSTAPLPTFETIIGNKDLREILSETEDIEGHTKALRKNMREWALLWRQRRKPEILKVAINWRNTAIYWERQAIIKRLLK